jgi:hypothetical protein
VSKPLSKKAKQPQRPSALDDICPICGGAILEHDEWALNEDDEMCHYECIHPQPSENGPLW